MNPETGFIDFAWSLVGPGLAQRSSRGAAPVRADRTLTRSTHQEEQIMAYDDRTITSRTGTGTLEPETAADANLDAVSTEGGKHQVGTGVGAAGGGTLGAVIGGAVGGPVGAMIGAAVGGLTGGLAGMGLAESINPTEEDAFWRSSYEKRPYAQGRTYDELRPAYQYGWESRCSSGDCSWNEKENELASGWEKAKGETKLTWQEAKHATRDAWDRIDQRAKGSASKPA